MAKKSKKKIVILEIQDGIIEPIKVAKGVDVIVRDYDTDGCDLDDERLKTDKAGNHYYESIY